MRDEFTKAMERIQFVVYGENKKRLSAIETDESLQISIDLHGLSVIDADKLVNNVVNIVSCPVSVELIHGYTHGTVLKEHYLYRYHNKKVRDIKPVRHNYGKTMLMVA